MKNQQLKPDHHEDAKKIIEFTSSVEPVNEMGMTRKEQIIEILKKTLGFDGAYYETGAFNNVASEIYARQQEWLREELIKYDEWIETVSLDDIFLTNEGLVDEYLKRKK